MGQTWDGFITGALCINCGKALDGQGAGHPAESYAGTYTGLCDRCTLAPAFVAKTYRDGAVLWSVPPHCPSWRRDREHYHAYPDCQDCGGRGYHRVSQDYGKGGPYNAFCARCMSRFNADPLRDKYWTMALSIMARARRDFDKAHAKALKERGLKATDSLSEGVTTAIQLSIWRRTQRHRALLSRWAERRRVHE